MIEVKNIGGREHPDYAAKKPLSDFLLATYRGGLGMQGVAGMDAAKVKAIKPSGYFAGLFKWAREATDDYINRVAITPFRPYSRRIVKAFVNYVTKRDPKRTGTTDEQFMADVDLKGHDIKTFVRSCLARQRVLGVFNILVDMPPASETPAVSLADEQATGRRPYCIPILPQQIVDWEIDPATGKYKWLIYETTTTVNSVADESAKTVTRRYYWDASEYQVWEKDGEKSDWKPVSDGPHPCGEVPVIRIEDDDVDDSADTPESWFYDLADINRAIYNLESIDIVNFHYQCFGQLILPESMQDKGETVASHAEAWTETNEESGISRYIQTSGIEHEVIEKKILTLRQEMYRLAGLFHRTDSAVAETAEAKAWDRDEMSQFLAAFADTAEYIEQEIFRLAGLWSGKRTEVTVEYPKDFKIEDIEALVSSALDMKSIGWASETGRKEVQKRLYHEILQDKVGDDVLKTIDKEIDASEEADPLAQFGGTGMPNNGIDVTPPTDGVNVGSRVPAT